jgi:hypothetical protein
METMFPYPPVLAAAIFVVELLLNFAVKRVSSRMSGS